MFKIYPAVDIRGGKCVRLLRGDYAEERIYFDDPLQAARLWKEKGASFLHVVDLDGAREGHPVNRETILKIITQVGIPVQVGGGIRELSHIEDYIRAGAARVILGTRAIEEPGFLEEALSLWSGKVLVSVDVGKEGKPAIAGWREKASVDAEELADRLAQSQVARIIHTNTWKDGTLEGYDPRPLDPFLERGLKVIAAGGIASMKDLLLLRGLSEKGVEGAVLGRALYTGNISLEEALSLEEQDRDET